MARLGRILVVGRHSFLAQHVLAALSAVHVEAIGHDEIERPGLLDGVGCVVNFARHPMAASDDYRPEQMDADLRLARRIGRGDIAYVMLSSRKVYAPSEAPLSETSPIGPSDAYGRNKLAVEEALRDLLGERLTVLRLANVFGYERTPGRRTFVAISLDRLAREGRIHYAMSPFVARDFLPVGAFAQVLARIAQAPPGGILNLGSGIGLPTGRLALWLLEGFGRGALVIESTEEKDAFVLDIGRLEALYGRPCSFEDLRDACLAIGRRLAKERAQASR
ncbi:MAG: NAD-dependent epimerase/dehydratase family protein [Geminicoccaceae bacterium]